MTTPTTPSAPRGSILVVDDDPDLLRLMQIRLSTAGHDVITAQSAEHALAQLTVARPQVVVTDIRMDGMDGLALFDAIGERNPTLPVIVLTAHGTIPDAVSAVQRGVFGYLTKPFDAKVLIDEIQRALAATGRQPAAFAGDDPADELAWRRDIITRNRDMEDVLAKARLVAQKDASVFIRGESGTGKALLARAIHRAGPRSAGPFVAIDCGAIPEPLLEAELFGDVQGVDAGAAHDRPGLIRTANHGTLFLDNIGDMPLPLQVRLLHTLQVREIRPAGTAADGPSGVLDVRVICASHCDIEAALAAGNFREDLYYWLNVVTLSLPPLAARRDDIPLLAQHFSGQLAQKYDKTLVGFSPEAIELLVTAAWPGNVRQLHNVVEQAVALATTPVIPVTLVQQAQQGEYASFEQARRDFERNYLAQLLKITDGNVTQAARLAKRNRTEFYKLLQRHQLEPKMFKPARQA